MNAILGYAGAAPSLYRSVDIKTGQKTFGINVDSNYASTGSDTIKGAYLMVARTSSLNLGPAVRIGYKDNTNSLDVNEEINPTGPGWTTNFTNGDFGEMFLADTLFHLQINSSPSNFNYSVSWQPTMNRSPGIPEALNTIATGGMYWQTALDPMSLRFPTVQHLDSGFRVKVTDASVNGNFFWVDARQTTHACRYSVDGDDSLTLTGSITAIVNSGLGVPPGPTGYSIHGQDQGFWITFETGAITAGLDSTASVIRLSWRSPSHEQYIVTPIAYNSAAGNALEAMHYYVKNIDNQTFELHGAVTNWSGLGFLPNTWYTFAFKTIDIGQ